MATTAALSTPDVLSTILRHLSDMKYKDRRQYGPDQPVEFLEFRPTLVPSILVSKMWADEGTSILWKHYPHLPALKHMSPERRQYYAAKINSLFCLSPPSDSEETLDYLDDLRWPSLKRLELEVDLQIHGPTFRGMLHDGLEHLDLSGFQSGVSHDLADVILPMIMNNCNNLKSIRIGSDMIADDDPLEASTLCKHMQSNPSLRTIEIKSTNLVDKTGLFTLLSQRPGLEGLEIDLDPGLTLLPLLSAPDLPSAPPFASLKRASIMCYPEIALALPKHLRSIERLQLDVARIPSLPSQPEDIRLLEDLISEISRCPQLRVLQIGIDLLAIDFPSAHWFPRLSGAALTGLAKSCPKLEDINFLAVKPSAIDGSLITSSDFETFCQHLPNLHSLQLKLAPTTTSSIQTTALHSLGRHCTKLETLRLKVPYQLPSLPVPDRVPQILISGGSTPEPPFLQAHPFPVDESEPNRLSTNESQITEESQIHAISPLFPKLTHLALCRPDSALATVPDSFTTSSASFSNSGIVDPSAEEDIVRSWAHALFTHFPRLEVLEAWGDWTGHDNESLNYFLPTQEILASTWEFLSGVEQDLWEDDDEIFDENSWISQEDWDSVSFVNGLSVDEQSAYPDIGKLSVQDEPEGMRTPGRTLEKDEYFGGTEGPQVDMRT